MTDKDTNEFIIPADPELLRETSAPSKEKFLASLARFSEKDIAAAPRPKEKPPISKMIAKAAYVLSLLVLAVCVVWIAADAVGKQTGDNYYQGEMDDFFDSLNGNGGNKGGEAGFLASSPMLGALTDFTTTLNNAENGVTPPVSPEINEQLELIRAQLTSMKRKNDEIFGIIKVEGTNISYPLVRHDDNDYYLDHSTDHKFLVLGSIFLDFRNTTYLYNNYNSILYGHNMTSGTMFHEIERFEDEEELFNTSKIYVYTMEGIYIFTPFSFYRTEATGDYIRTAFATGDDFAAWANNAAGRSIYEFDGTITAQHRILTLSTCINYSANNAGRFALHAVLTEVISD